MWLLMCLRFYRVQLILVWWARVWVWLATHFHFRQRYNFAHESLNMFLFAVMELCVKLRSLIMSKCCVKSVKIFRNKYAVCNISKLLYSFSFHLHSHWTYSISLLILTSCKTLVQHWFFTLLVQLKVQKAQIFFSWIYCFCIRNCCAVVRATLCAVRIRYITERYVMQVCT